MAGTESLTLPETVFLMLVPDDGRLPADSGLYVDIAQAHVVDLGLSGSLRTEDDHVHPVPGREPTAPGLQTAYKKLCGKDSWSLKTDIHFARLMPTAQDVARGLVAQGVLEERKVKRLGILPVPIFPASDPAVRKAMRERLSSVLLGASAPQEHDAALFLLIAEDLIRSLIEAEQRSEAQKHAGGIIAEASPEGSFLCGYAKARAKDFWRSSPGIRDWLG